MAGEMGLTISPVSIALHSTGYSSLSACRGCEMRVVQAGAADLVASPPSSQAKNLHDIGLLATGSSSLQLCSSKIFRSSSKSRIGFLQPYRRACTARPFACRVTVGPLPTCYTASESAI